MKMHRDALDEESIRQTVADLIDRRLMKCTQNGKGNCSADDPQTPRLAGGLGLCFGGMIGLVVTLVNGRG